MRSILLMTLMGLLILLLCACVPFPLYNDVKSDLEVTRAQKDDAQRELDNLRSNHAETAARLQLMQSELSKLETRNRQLAQKVKKFQTQNAYLKNINQQQQKNIDALGLELKKRRSVIQLQGKVIQLLDDTKKTIETSLKDQIAAQEIEVVEADDKLKVIFIDKILFDSGSVDINVRGKELLKIMAGSLKGAENQEILVEGHTDDVPLSAALRKRFPSNWELSTARAAAVARFLHQAGGLEPQKLSARGYSFYRPVASNETEKGRHQNRRIEIILAPKKKMTNDK
jgi:chemotaxis protein MotB